jgi:hypothetical protein
MGEIVRIQEEFKALMNSFSLMNQEVLNLTERQDVMNQDVKELGFKVGNMQHIFDAAMDKIQGLPRLQQPDQGRFEKSMMSSKSTTTTSILISANSISDLPKNATSTGTISTILPTITFNAPETTSFMNEFFIYEEEEEEFTLMPNDENFLSSEDHEFVDSISSSTFSGIFLQSLFYDFSKYLMPPEPTLSNFDDSANAASDLTIVVQKSFSSQPFSDVLESLLFAEYDVISRILVFVIDEYVIFVWDPGKFYFLKL